MKCELRQENDLKTHLKRYNLLCEHLLFFNSGIFPLINNEFTKERGQTFVTRFSLFKCYGFFNSQFFYYYFSKILYKKLQNSLIHSMFAFAL